MAGGVDYLYEPQGAELHWDALKSAQPQAPQQASLSGPSNPMVRKGLGGTTPNKDSFRAQRPSAQAPRAPKAPSPDELLRQAQAMLAEQEVRNSHSLAQGPSTGPRDDSGSQTGAAQTPGWLEDYMSGYGG